MQASDLFQKKAMDRLRSPERLDKLFTVIGPMDWLILTAVALLIFSVSLWAVFGVMADKVTGYGIIVDSSGTASISHPYGVQVSDIHFNVGDTVKEGQVVATIRNDDIIQKILLTKEQLNLSLRDTDLKGMAAEITSLREQFLHVHEVVSPHNGIIIEKRVNKGDVIGAGASIYTVITEDNVDEIIAVIYVNPLQGSKIEPGMTVQISPGAIDPSEYGSLVGKVVYVSNYPVSIDHPLTLTGGNRELSNWFFQKNGGAAVAVIVHLIKDDNTPSGYLWTSVVGPDNIIKSGSVCTGTAITKRQSPFAKAFKKFSQWVRSD
jgi:multidrug efflux pump subunit AcrA (membrane-fusion protein)